MKSLNIGLLVPEWLHVFKNITLKNEMKHEVLFTNYKYIEKLAPISDKVKKLLGKYFKKI